MWFSSFFSLGGWCRVSSVLWVDRKKICDYETDHDVDVERQLLLPAIDDVEKEW